MIRLLILRYLKEIAQYRWSVSNLIAFMRMNLFVKIQLSDWLDNPFKPPEDSSMDNRQINLFSGRIEIQKGKNLSNTHNYPTFFISLKNLFWTAVENGFFFCIYSNFVLNK